MIRYSDDFIYYLYQQSGRYFFYKKVKKIEMSNIECFETIRELSFYKDELDLIDFNSGGLNLNDKEVIANMINEFESQ